MCYNIVKSGVHVNISEVKTFYTDATRSRHRKRKEDVTLIIGYVPNITKPPGE